MISSEEIPDAPVMSLGQPERVLIWCFRILAEGPQCLARLAAGLSSVVVAEETLAAALVVRDVFYGVNWESSRRIGIFLAPAPKLSWDEMALLALFAATRTNCNMIMLWMRRLGVSEPSSTLRASLDQAASILSRSDALPKTAGVGALGSRAPVQEPEIMRLAIGVLREPGS